MSLRATHSQVGSPQQEVACLVRLVEHSRDDDRVAGWRQCLGQPARRPKRRVRSQTRANLRKLEDLLTARVHLGQRVT